jgi:UDP-glucose-4-epimerase GalE
MRVLATGGAGYVGSHCVRALKKAGHEVEVLDDLSRGHRSFAEALGVRLHQTDLRDAASTEKVLARGYDAVLHFAAFALVPESVERPSVYWDVNLRGGLSLLRAMRLAGVKRIVVSSTAAVYGEPLVIPVPEDSPRAPVNPYGATKLAFEFALDAEGRATGLRHLALRYFNASGASEDGLLGERHDPETHLIPNLIQAAKKGTPFQVCGRDHPTRDGSCLRDFIHVEDLARAHVLALEKLDGIHETALNLGSGTGQTVLEVLETAEKVLGKKIPREDRPRRPGDPSSLVCDPSRARAVLGFETEKTLEDSIRTAARFLERDRG